MVLNRNVLPRHPPLGWVVVANAARARFFDRDDDNGALRETADFVHPAARARAASLDSGRPGRVRKGEASTAFAPHTPVHEHERALFASELAQQLERAALEHRMPSLVLLASNPFLGELKAQLGPAALRQLRAALPTDFTSFQGAELELRISQALRAELGAAAAAE